MKYVSLLAFSALPAFAADLEILTYESFASEWGPGPQLEALYEAKCECDIKFVTAPDAVAMLKRIELEGDDLNADIILGLDQNLIERAKRENILEKNNVATSFSDLEGDELVAFDWGYFAFVYREGEFDIPTNFEELANSDLKISIQDPQISSPGLGLAMWVYEAYGDRASEIWANLKDNVSIIAPSWTESYTVFTAGEVDMTLSYVTSPAYHALVEGDDGYNFAKFDEGHGLQIEFAGILSGSQNVDLANDFLSFLLDEEAQLLIASGNFMLPVKENALPEGFPDSRQIQPLHVEANSSSIDNALEAFDRVR